MGNNYNEAEEEKSDSRAIIQRTKGFEHKGQAKKGAGRMPWHWEPMKDVVNCDKLRGVVSRRYIRRFPNGATRLIADQSTYTE